MYKFRNDLILIFTLVLICVVTLLLFFSLNKKDNLVAYIYYDKDLMYQVELIEEKEIVINDVIICIGEGFVYIKDSDCKDKICVHQGKITVAGQTITCLPNKVYIKLEGKEVDIGV